MNPFIIFLVVIIYIGFLFYIAYTAEKETGIAGKFARSPIVYSLSLAVYCTSWTFYGSVGKAASSGLSFLAVYIGPTLMICLWWILLRRMVLIKDKYRITSIADFISARYGKSQVLAGVVTLIALVGNMPYIALQMKAIKSSFSLITTTSGASSSTWIIDHFGPFIVIIMTFFTILFGARKLDPTERHRGMIAAVAMESVVKLFAFLACGIYVTYFLAGGFSEIFSPTFLNHPGAATVIKLGDGNNAYVTWTTLIILGMSAIMFLPRQFHVAVIENSSPRNILPAMWQFPLYMVMINIFVVPIALFGINAGIPVQQADTYVLSIPISHGNMWMALLVFIGGFAAATGMIMIAAMTMSTMVVNHLCLPLFNILQPLAGMRRHLLRWHWIGIIAILSGGYWTETKLGESYALVNMGLISFAAVLQFAPAAIGALLWQKGSKAGALAGLITGFALWFYTLLLPAFAKSGWFDSSFLDKGPWGISILRPEHLFGMNTLPALSHAVFWSLLFNLGLFVLISCLFRQSEEEHRIAQDFHSLSEKAQAPTRSLSEDKSISIADKHVALLEVLNEYFPPEKSMEILNQSLARRSLLGQKNISIIDFSEYHRSIENILAGSIGSAMAHRALNRDVVFPRKEKLLLSKAYADILSRLNVSPQELSEKINFYREREELLMTHSKELEKRIVEKEQEIEARTQAERALQEAELQYRSIFDNALEGIFQTSADGRLLTVNPAMATILGYDSPETLMREVPDIRVHMQTNPGRRDTFFRRLLTGKQVNNFEIQVTHANGKILWISLNARPILDDQGKLTKIEGIAEDISKRKEAEDKLKRYHEELEETVRLRTAEVLENQTFLQELLEGIQAAVIVVQQESIAVMDCNSITEQLLGYDKKALMAAEGSFEKDSVLFADLGEKSLNKEFVVECRDGGTIPVLRNVLPVIYKGVPAYAIILFDISERKALELQVNMAQKLQSIGQLAAGIAHEINTPIQYIGSNLSFLSESFGQLLEVHKGYSELMDRAKAGDDISQAIEEVSRQVETLDLEFLQEEIPHAVTESLSGVDQVASIVKAMKQFAHPEQDNLTTVDINSALQQTAAISKNEWKYVAELQMDLDNINPVIDGYPGPLNQVFLNMMINAAHAIQEKVGDSGRKGHMSVRTTSDDSSVIISIADTGCGIPADKIQKIFDPFFTTKAVGKGTGQGLSIAYTIITEKHKGTIEVESEVGRGTTFTIRLPLHLQITEKK
ncbi:MAG: PAS domain S-box protein [Proteobacteria bacterium]|nr:PAS domain S-box protein [Pseudomonadota bacterium]